MGWDNTMPSTVADGVVIDDGDINPILNNLNYVHYATVFQGGTRRTTTLGSIVGTEVAAIQTPSVSFETGTIYKIEGMLKWLTTVGGSTDDLELRVHEGAGLLGAVVQSFASQRAPIAAAGYMTPFNAYVKITGAVTRPYTLGVRRLSGTGTITVDITSQMVILRSGDSTLMTDV
jgi:hypothetical protein